MIWLCLDHCLVDEGGAVNTGAEDAPMTRIFMLKIPAFLVNALCRCKGGNRQPAFVAILVNNSPYANILVTGAASLHALFNNSDRGCC